MVTQLAPDELIRRAQRVRLVLTDVDGVLTDARAYYSARGEELKSFSLRDGMGVELLREAGIETGFITREQSPIVMRRAEKLGLRVVELGVRDKLAHLPELLRRNQLQIEELAYIGDDVNDLPVLIAVSKAGLAAAPADAVPAVLRAVHYRTQAPGGHGAFREVAEFLLSLRGGTLPSLPPPPAE